MFVPKVKFVGSIQFEILTIVWRKLKGTYHLWISRFDFFHFWYSKTTILFKDKNAFKFKKFNLEAKI